jgi:hypothetical protein
VKFAKNNTLLKEDSRDCANFVGKQLEADQEVTMKSKIKNDCPYLNKPNKSCYHKEPYQNRSLPRTDCIYKDCTKCPVYCKYYLRLKNIDSGGLE